MTTLHRVRGGHAVMLGVRVPPSIVEFAKGWCRNLPATRRLTDNHHVTLCFMGRDLPVETGREMIQTVKCAIVPDGEVDLQPEGFSMFGWRRDHLVLELKKDPPGLFNNHLGLIRDVLKQGLIRRGLRPRNDFEFRPHVTLAKGKPGATGMVLDCPPIVTEPVVADRLIAKVGEDLHVRFLDPDREEA